MSSSDDSKYPFLSKEECAEWQKILVNLSAAKQTPVANESSKSETVNLNLKAARQAKKVFLSTLAPEKQTLLAGDDPKSNDHKDKAKGRKYGDDAANGDIIETDLSILTKELHPKNYSVPLAFYEASSLPRIFRELENRDLLTSEESFELVDIGMNLHCKMPYEDILEVLRRAAAVGVTRIILTGSNIENSRTAYKICERYYYKDRNFDDIKVRLYHTVGIHPHEAHSAIVIDNTSGERTVHHEKIEDILEIARNNPFCVSFGECGLDYQRMLSNRDDQLMVLAAQIESCVVFNSLLQKEKRKALFVHLREPDFEHLPNTSAILDMVTIINNLKVKYGDGFDLSQVVVHCVTSDLNILSTLRDHGVYVGFTGYIGISRRSEDSGTSQAIRRLSEKLDFLSYVMIETDAPYMRPDRILFPDKSFRILKKLNKGSNEPATLPITNAVLAYLVGISPKDVATITTRNAIAFFKLMQADEDIMVEGNRE